MTKTGITTFFFCFNSLEYDFLCKQKNQLDLFKREKHLK